MAKRKTIQGTMIIAGPGAGKTHNMVGTIIDALPDLSACRYMVVITYTNSATNNILKRLSLKITIPENLFIGTMHAFFNKFVVIPFASFDDNEIGAEKLFMQCATDDVFQQVERLKETEKRSKTPQAAAIIKSRITKRLNKLGYITFDQTLTIAKKCIVNDAICKLISNRLQFLFVDEFQDSGNDVFSIIEGIRKHGKTKIYCVGDPEQYIQSFDSSIRSFGNIPILKAAASTGYHIKVNDANYRSTQKIVTFLNQFNGRNFNSQKFAQRALSKSADPLVEAEIGEDVLFIQKWKDVTSIIAAFNTKCDSILTTMGGRCILAKKNDVIARIIAAVGNQYMNPKRSSNVLPMKVIQDTLLSTLQLNQTTFCEKYQTNIYTLRKYVVAIFKAINAGFTLKAIKHI